MLNKGSTLSVSACEKKNVTRDMLWLARAVQWNASSHWDRQIYLYYLCDGVLKPMWKPMAGAVNMPCSSSYGSRTWQHMYLSFLGSWQAVFFPLFLFYGMDHPHSSALIGRGEAKGNWGALVLWHQTAELRSDWISKLLLPRQNGHFKWGCGLQWRSTRRLPTEDWPSKTLIYLYVSL